MATKTFLKFLKTFLKTIFKITELINLYKKVKKCVKLSSFKNFLHNMKRKDIHFI